MLARNGGVFPKQRRLVVASALPIAVLLFVLYVFKQGQHQLKFHYVGSSDEGRLNKDAVQVLKKGSMRIGGRRLVIATAVTVHYAQFLENLRCWMHQMGAGELVVFGLDEGMVNYGRSRGFLTVDFAKEEEIHNRKFGRKGFNIVTKRKLEVAYAILREGFDLVFTDVDVVWCGDVIGELIRKLERRKRASGWKGKELILVQNDVKSDNEHHVSMNSGFYYARSGRAVVDLWERMFKHEEKHNKINDQDVFNRVACKIGGGGRAMDRTEHGRGVTVCEWEGRVELEALPLKEYVNGGAWVGENKKKLFQMPKGIVGQMCRKGDFEIIHNNWCRGEGEKLRRFKWANLWAWDEKAGKCVFASDP